MSENNPSPRIAVEYGARPGVATRLKSELGRSIKATDLRCARLMAEMEPLEDAEGDGSLREVELVRRKVDLSIALSKLDHERRIWQSMEKDGWQYSTPEGE